MKRDNHYTNCQAIMHEWGAWARRPQFWARLRMTGAWAMLPMPRESWPVAEIRLSPQSRAIQSVVMQMDDKRSGVLYAYYVCGCAWDNKPEAFKQHGIGRTQFYDVLREATLMAANRAKTDGQMHPFA